MRSRRFAPHALALCFFVAGAGCAHRSESGAPPVDAGSSSDLDASAGTPLGGSDSDGSVGPSHAGPPAGVYGAFEDASTCPQDAASTFVGGDASDQLVTSPDGVPHLVPLPSYAGGAVPPMPCVCVSVDLSAYDRSCQNARECAPIGVGVLCSNQCLAQCGNALVNALELSRYQEAIAPLVDQSSGTCNCPAAGVPACVHGQCVMQLEGGSGR